MAAFGDPPVRDIGVAAPGDGAARTQSDGCAVEEAAAEANPCRGLKTKSFLFCASISIAEHATRAFRGRGRSRPAARRELDAEFGVAIRRRQPFHQTLVASRRVGEGVRRDVETAARVGLPQGGEGVGAPEEVGRAVDDEGDWPPAEGQPPTLPARLGGRSDRGRPAALAEEVANDPCSRQNSPSLAGLRMRLEQDNPPSARPEARTPRARRPGDRRPERRNRSERVIPAYPN